MLEKLKLDKLEKIAKEQEEQNTKMKIDESECPYKNQNKVIKVIQF